MKKIELYYGNYKDQTGRRGFTSEETFAIANPVVWYDGENVYYNKRTTGWCENYSDDGMRYASNSESSYDSLTDRIIPPKDIPEAVMQDIKAAYEE